MKKFYTLLAAAMMTLAANAQMYICGEIATWSPETATAMEKQADGSYTFTYTANGNAQEFTVATKQGGWDATDGWKANALTCTPENGKFVALTKGSANMKTPRYKKDTEATITVNAARNQLKIEGTLDGGPATLKFFGNLNGSGTWTEYALTDGKYVLTVTSTCYFTFTTGSWGGAWRPDNGETVITENGTYGANGNNDKVFVIKKAGTYTITPNEAAKSFTVTGFSGDEPGPQPSALKFFGDLNGAGYWTAYDLTDGKYTFEVTSTSYFSFSDGEPKSDWSNVWRPDNGETEVTENGTYSAKGSNDKAFFITTPGTYTVTPDATAKTFSITGFSGTVTYPETLYIIGYVNGLDFQANTTGMASTKAENGVYTWVGALIGDATAGTGTEAVGYINIATMVSAEATDWDSVINSADRYGAPAADTPLVVGTPADVEVYKAGVNASGCQSWKVKEGKYDVTLDIPSLKISIVAITSGIESVEVENAAPVYYNLQGVRVMNPENGMFIEVRGNKAVKVMK